MPSYYKRKKIILLSLGTSMISLEHIITPQGLERITSQACKWMSRKDMNHHSKHSKQEFYTSITACDWPAMPPVVCHSPASSSSCASDLQQGSKSRLHNGRSPASKQHRQHVQSPASSPSIQLAAQNTGMIDELLLLLCQCTQFRKRCLAICNYLAGLRSLSNQQPLQIPCRFTWQLP